MEDLQRIIIRCYEVLKQNKRYKAKIIVGKMETLGYKVSESSFSKIINSYKVGEDTLQTVYQGITLLLGHELRLLYDEESKQFTFQENLPEESVALPLKDRKFDHGVSFHYRGRLSIQQKVEFVQTANKEVIEVGARLRTFANYFNSRAEYEFTEPIRELLENGVNFKLYVVDPNSHEALYYFRDRSSAMKDEARSIEIIKEVLRNLRSFSLEIEALNYPGKFGVFTYKHIPCSHYLIVDGATQGGRMMVSNYLFGIKRADCPVVEVIRQQNRGLYNKYYTSFRRFTEGARELDLQLPED